MRFLILCFFYLILTLDNIYAHNSQNLLGIQNKKSNFKQINGGNIDLQRFIKPTIKQPMHILHHQQTFGQTNFNSFNNNSVINQHPYNYNNNQMGGYRAFNTNSNIQSQTPESKNFFKF
jgi:hypothetical protein